jgi:hypothetical protein
MSAQLLPDETAKQAAAQLAAGQVQFLLKPGTKISLQLDLTGPPGDATWRQKYEQWVTQYLNNDFGLVVAEGQPIKLKLSAQESDTGEKVKAVVRTRQGRKTVKTEVSDVPLKRLTCQAALTDGQGKALMEPKSRVFEFPELDVTSDGKDDPAVVVKREQTKRLWDSLFNWLFQVGIPPFVARQGDTVVPWPKTAVLGQGQ